MGNQALKCHHSLTNSCILDNRHRQGTRILHFPKPLALTLSIARKELLTSGRSDAIASPCLSNALFLEIPARPRYFTLLQILQRVFQ